MVVSLMKLIELDKIFNITYGNKLDLNKMNIVGHNHKHAVAFVSRTREKNGIVSYVERIADIEPYTKGNITVALGGSVLSSFIQFDSFYTGQNVAVLSPLIEMSDEIKTYYCIAIKSNAYRYSTCGREANKTLKKLLVPDITEIPDWVRNSKFPVYGDIKNKSNNECIALSTLKWKAFRYDKLFDVKKGKRVTKLDLIKGNTPFISATDKSNGIREYSGLVAMHSAKTITVNYNGSVGEAFYQEQAFWASDDVNVLYPKFEINKYIAMFLITLIRHEKYRFNYGRKWHQERMLESFIKLPVKEDGTPDFDFIEKYIKSLPYSASI